MQQQKLGFFFHILEFLLLINYYPGDQFQKNWISRTCGTNGREYSVVVVKTEGKRSVGTPRSRRQDNIKIDVKETGCEGVDLIDLGQDKDRRQVFVNTVIILQLP